MEDSEIKFIDTNNNIDFISLIKFFYNKKKSIIKSTFSFGIFSIILSLSLTNLYTSEVHLAETDTYGTPLQQSATSSIAGLGLIGQTNFKMNQAQTLMYSWSFIQEFINYSDLSVSLYAGTKTDKDQNIVIDSNIYDTDKGTWVVKEPSSWKLYKKFSTHLAISQNKKDSTLIVSITHPSPKVAKEWVDNFVFFLNEYLRQNKLDQINSNIEYLQDQIEKTSITYMKESFFRIIEDQTKYKMLAEATPEYAFTTIKPSMISEIKSFPSRSKICILITMIGFFLTLIYLVIQQLGITKPIDDRFNIFKQKIYKILKPSF